MHLCHSPPIRTMLPLPYALARPILFSMDPEAAHDVTLALLARTQGTPLSAAYAGKRVDDPVQLAGLKFPNRLGLAAGLDKNARCIDGFAAMGFGFIEVGTVTPRAQPGNPKPRMFRLPAADALINRFGFNSGGLEPFIENLQSASVRAPGAGNGLILGINIGKNAATPIEDAALDYLACLDGVYPYADYIAINISSPNTKNLRSLQSGESLDGLLEKIADGRESLSRRHGKRVPLFVKIAPDLLAEEVDMMAVTIRRHQMDGVIATNTTVNRDAIKGLRHAQQEGGLSGAPVLQASNRVISRLRALLGEGFPIIGVGGVMSSSDAVSKIEAGADLVQIYTGLIYKGPALVTQSALAIQQKCALRI